MSNLELPWSVSKYGRCSVINSRTDGRCGVATCNTPDQAAAIVKAVNSHNELVGWLRRCEEMVSTDKGPPNWDAVRALLAKLEA